MEKRDELTGGVTGKHTTAGVPHGFTSLTPFLAVPNARAALEFYEEVFGAKVLDSTEMGGLVVHAEVDFGSGRLQIGSLPQPMGWSDRQMRRTPATPWGTTARTPIRL